MIEYFLMAFFAAGPSAARAQPASAVSPVMTSKVPVEISADRTEIQGKNRQIVLTGNVKAMRGPTSLHCDRAVAHYSESREVTRVECTSNVEVVDGDRSARGDRADFDALKGILEVTGSPQAKQGASRIEGSKVTLHTGKDLLTVENARVMLSSTPSQSPIEIFADRSEVLGRRRQIVLAGNVKAVKGSTTLRCSRAVAHYSAAHELRRVDCSNNVEVVDGDKWARGERAGFNVRTGIVEVTGNPQAKQGASTMEGTRVTLHVGKDLLEVENARLVLEGVPK